MRRILTQTTAIVLCLGLGLPQVATAQTLLPADKAAQVAGQRAKTMPRLAKALAAELEGGLTTDDLRCQMNAPRPCPDGTPLFTPGGLAVDVGEDGTILLAPRARQAGSRGQQADIVLAQAGGEPVVVPDAAEAAAASKAEAGNAGGDEKAAQAERRAAKEAERAERKAAKQAERQAAKEAAVEDDRRAAEQAPDAERAAADQAAEQADADRRAARQAARAERQAAAQAQAEAEAEAAKAEAAARDGADDGARAADLPPPADPQPDAPSAARSDEILPPTGDAPVVGRSAELPPPAEDKGRAKDKGRAQDKDRADGAADRPAGDATPDAAALAEALGRRDDKTPPTEPPVVVTPEQARAAKVPPESVSGEDPVVAAPEGRADRAKPPVAARDTPDRNAPVVTAAPAGTDANQSADALAQALEDAQAAPEARARETEASREAAAARPGPAAAALAEAAAPVASSEKRTVTRETSRQATEDFATDLSGKVRPGVQARDVPATPDAPPGAVVVEGGQDRPGGVVVTPSARGEAPVVEGENALTENGDDDDNDLVRDIARIGLPILAGLVAGQMLSNNREVALNTGDRVVVERSDGSYELIKDDNALLARPGSTVQTEEYADGSTRTIVTREDGSQVVTIRDADLRILRRTLVYPDGSTTALIDDTAQVQPVVVSDLPAPARPIAVTPGETLSEEALREALRREVEVDRSFTLGQIRAIPEVRALVAPVDIQAITFETGSAAIKPDQAQQLATLGRVIADSVRQNPREMFLIEGHTDAVGSAVSNLALSDRRAESVALALTEFFDVPPENMVVQGYGEQFLKIPQEGDIRANRRAAVRRITDLLARN